MKFKKLISCMLAFMFIIACFAGCSSSENEEETTTEIETTEVETTESLEELEEIINEIVTFDVKDEDKNVLTVVPIYNSDETEIVAGYVSSVADKSGNALTTDDYEYLNQVLSASGIPNEKLTLEIDDGYIILSAFADKKGNIIAIEDNKDLNENGEYDEYLRVKYTKNDNGINHYVVKLDVVTIEQDGDDYYFVNGDTKTQVYKVDASNEDVKNAMDETIEDNNSVISEAKSKAKKLKSTSSSDTTTTTKSSDSTTKSSSGSETTTKSGSSSKETTTSATTTTTEVVDDSISIVLEKNAKATCSSSNVSIEDGVVTIEAAGDYVVTSNTDDWHGQIVIKLANTEKCSVRFEDVTISNTTKNIIQIIDTSITSDRTFLEAEATAGTEADDEIENVADNDSAPNVTFSFPSGTSSSFTTSSSGYTGVIYNESKLTIKGNGSLTVSSTRNANNCICSTKSITIKNVDLTLTTAQNENTSSLAKTSGSAKGIYSYSKVTIESGSLTIKSNGDGVRCESFKAEGGTINISSSACDGVDADNSIVINAGTVNVFALEKTSLKVRRVNNTENGTGKGVRSGKGDTFEINGGTVIAESKKITTVQSTSSQASITCRVQKENKGSSEESKVPVQFTISTLNKTSTNKCIKYLYSSSSVKAGTSYTVSGGDKTTTVSWSGNVGDAIIISTK